MNHHTDDAELRLPRGAFLRVQDGGSLVLALREGFLWITRPGPAPDVMLAAGQHYRIDAPGLVLVQATEPSRLTLLSGGLRRRIAFEARGEGGVVEAGPAEGIAARVAGRIARAFNLDGGISTWDMDE